MRADARIAITWILAASPVLVHAGCSEDGPAVTIPEGTPLTVSLYSTTRSDRVTAGETLLAKIEREVVVDGVHALREGDLVTLEVLDSREATEDQPARMLLRVVTLEYPDGRTTIGTHALDFVGRPVGSEDRPDPAAGGSGDAPDAGGAVLVPTRGSTLVLPAGKQMRFVTSRAFEVSASPR